MCSCVAACTANHVPSKYEQFSQEHKQRIAKVMNPQFLFSSYLIQYETALIFISLS